MNKINKILIANRGEIAVRIIRACREMNIQTVAIYSTVDVESLHVILADEAICIGDHRLMTSYLNQEAILQAAVNSGVQAIHPGYGFLSENANFAKACERLNLKFIGPKYQTIEQMGDKQSARDTMSRAGVPIVPGSLGLVEDYQQALKEVKNIGYPVLIKATAGGGGKGMRVCYQEADLKAAFSAASNEALNAFGDGSVYLERFIENPRHIEVQVIGDEFGNVAHLFERECSVQRNNQKMIEEAPVENLKASTKKQLYAVALKAAKSIGYISAGTLEFIMDEQENFYFIEINTRIQVEHPITEMISGIDLIKEQIRVADGQKLSFKQKDLKILSHAIEIRINAEDPYDNFKPSAGFIEGVHFPGGNGVRVDSFIYQGYSIQPWYDSMIAKVIVQANNRAEAIDKAVRCLEEMDIYGVITNAEFQLEILLCDQFLSNTYNTSLVKHLLAERDHDV
ncbi:MAG: acetyl-CoA carboxylase biotin carboxylase subunit [Erysipelotrichaceae bacterium]